VLDELLKILNKHKLKWADLPEIFSEVLALHGTAVFRPKHLRNWNRLQALHELMGRGDPLGERWTARNKLIKWLVEANLSWNDLPSILASLWRDNSARPPPASAPAGEADINLLDVLMAIIQKRVVMPETECVVVALWVLNSYLFDTFTHAPQLGIVAPASSCGKSTLRKVVEALARSAWHSHHATPAVVYRVIERDPRTVISLDEAENLDWSNDSKMRAIIDAAFESDGCVHRVDSERNPFEFRVFAPVLWALRGSASDMPIAVVSRGFVITMKKGRPEIRLSRHFSEDSDFITTRNLAEAWAASVQLDLDPEMPAELSRDPRLADKCRALISVADSLGRGTEARAALIQFCAGLPNSDIGVQALEDCKKAWATKAGHLFTLGASDRISKKNLVAGMIEENPFWGSWRGPRDKGQPHPLTSGELSHLLLGFGIRPKTVWPVPRRPNDKSVTGYMFGQFTVAWAEHLADDHTPAQASKIIRLDLHKQAKEENS
jgi:hypothetical protein